MSLKENVSAIKEEISTQEQFFESFFKLEKFYKKYKIAIFAITGLILAYFISTAVLDYQHEQKTIASNAAYDAVLVDSKDSINLAILKDSNQKLFDIAMYQTNSDKTKSIDVTFLKDIVIYNKAIQENDISSLNNLIINPNFILKDFALFNKALILSNNKDYISAKETLKMIPMESAVASLSSMLEHYLLTK
ncbi:MAG TPA: hypothetical protein EYG73_01315 [Arcobacter sp.]|nr:hypothetical protein [Arcobacter sp.]